LSDEQEARYKVTFLGPVQNDLANVNKLAEGLKDRFKLSDEAITKMMKMAPVAIKAGATLSEAEKYKDILEAIGARVQVEPIEELQEEPQPTEESPPPLNHPPPREKNHKQQGITLLFSIENPRSSLLRQKLPLLHRRRPGHLPLRQGQGNRWSSVLSVGMCRNRRMNASSAA